MRSGENVTYAHGLPLWHERYRDDGVVLQVEIIGQGSPISLRIDRASRRVSYRRDGAEQERDFPPGVVPLENGSWQSYALLADWPATGPAPAPVKVLLPGDGRTVDATVRVAALDDGARAVELSLGPTRVLVELGADGLVRRAVVPSQLVEMAPKGEPPRIFGAPPPPESVAVEAWDVAAEGAELKAELWLPRGVNAPPPLVVFIAGSGPTDRNGNNPLGGPTSWCHSYAALAEALAARGVATLRFDKRGVGQSSTEVPEEAMTLETFVDDAAAIFARARGDGRFSHVTALGHSEGGLIALTLAGRRAFDRVVLVATPGRPLHEVMREQFARSLEGDALAAAELAITHLREGRDVPPLPPPLQRIFRPSARAALRSLFEVDPPALLRDVATPVAVVQGGADVQVTSLDAERLRAANPRARVTVLAEMNHLLKVPAADAPCTKWPLAPGLVDAVVAGVVGDGASTPM